MPYADPAARKAYAARHYRENSDRYKDNARKNGLANEWYESSRDKDARNEARRVKYATDESYADACKTRVKEFRAEDPERWQAYWAGRYAAEKAAEGTTGTPTKRKASGVESRASARVAVISVLGRACKRCGEKEAKFLNVDHVLDDGAIHRRAIKSGTSSKVHQEVLFGKFQGKYQLLCWNCNHLKYLESLPEATWTDCKNPETNCELRSLAPLAVFADVAGYGIWIF